MFNDGSILETAAMVDASPREWPSRRRQRTIGPSVRCLAWKPNLSSGGWHQNGIRPAAVSSTMKSIWLLWAARVGPVAHAVTGCGHSERAKFINAVNGWR